MTPSVLDRPLLGLADPVLDLGEGLLDRIEIGRIGWERPESCSGGADRAPHGCGLVAAEIVHDDDVARFKDRRELLLDIGAETFAVDWPVEDAGSGEPIMPQRAEKGQRSPMALWGEPAQALALRSPTAQRRHVGFDPGFVDKDQPPGIETILP